MSSRPKFNSPEAIARRFAEGRGQGEGRLYIPWILISDFPSWGQRRRSYCHITKRPAHSLSRLEYANRLLATNEDGVVDLQENLPLDRAKSVEIAFEETIKHPMAAKDCPIVMSTDLRITIMRDGKRSFKIWTTKYSDALRNWRTLEKLRIDKLYWQNEPGHTWELRTEVTLPRTFRDNVEWIYPMLRPGALFGISPEDVRRAEEVMSGPALRQDSPLTDITNWADRHLSLSPGTSTLIARYLMAIQRWRVDLCQPINPLKPIRLKAT